MDKKGVSIFIVVLILLFGVLYALSVFTQQPRALDRISDVDQTELELRSNDQVKGNPEANLVLVKYSDFQCPACASAYPFASSLVDEFGDDLAFVYRHFPLPQFRHSLRAAIASEAAGRQGAFWPMHDLIFDNQGIWSGAQDANALFVSYAEDLGLNIEQFVSDLESTELESKVMSDRASGDRLGVQATPTFFLNGEHINTGDLPARIQEILQSSTLDIESDLESEVEIELNPELETDILEITETEIESDNQTLEE